jgi:hypothetical protein
MIGRSDACAALRAHRQKIRDLHLRTLFTEDPARGERLAVEAAGLRRRIDQWGSSTAALIRRCRRLRDPNA